MRAGRFRETQLLLDLEAIVLKDMEKDVVDGLYTSLFFNTHARWAAWMVDDCLNKKNQPMKRFHDFWRYNDQLYERCARILVEKWADLTNRQAMIVLMNGNVTNLKRHA